MSLNDCEILVGIADAVEKSEVDINPKLIQNLEEKILDNIIEVADENPDYNQGSIDRDFIPNVVR